MCDIDEILNEEAKHLVIQEDDLCEQQDYRFVAIVDVYSVPFVELSQKLKYCKNMSRVLDKIIYISRHSDIVLFFPDIPEKRPDWLSESLYKICKRRILGSGFYVRFVFGFSGSFKTLNERKHIFWWFRKYMCKNNLCDITLVRPYDEKKLEVDYNWCGVLGKSLHCPGSQVSTHIFQESKYNNIDMMERRINEFFDGPKLAYDFLDGRLYMMDGISLFDPTKTFILNAEI
jgi:hypothetical protein